MDADQQRSIVADCAALMAHSFILLDDRRYDALAELFGEDGEWMRGGKPCRGFAGIMDSLSERPDDIVIRHLLTNVDITVLDPENAEGIGYFMVYKAKGDGGPPPLPARLGAPAMVAEVRDRYRLWGDTWRIARRDTARIFE